MPMVRAIGGVEMRISHRFSRQSLGLAVWLCLDEMLNTWIRIMYRC